MGMIEDGDYFTINRPRQYGKTTTMFLLERELLKTDCSIASISFEGLGDSIFQKEESFVKSFIWQIKKEFEFHKYGNAVSFINQYQHCKSIDNLSDFISALVFEENKEIVLMIDEVDKSSNNQLFLSFIGMLRNKFLRRNVGKDHTFHSVVLAGVHDVKNLKLKLRPGEEQKFNSPWNIAVDFNVDLSFNPGEIATMLIDYSKSENVQMDIKEISEQIFYYTSGYPFLVSFICKIFDEEILPGKNNKECNKHDIELSTEKILHSDNTNFDSLIKSLENNKELYNFVENILLGNLELSYTKDNYLMNFGSLHGIFKQNCKTLKIHNLIYEQRIFNYITTNIIVKQLLNKDMGIYNFKNDFLFQKNQLDIEKIMIRFQLFMKEQFTPKDTKFLEQNGRLVFLAFLKPIINGHGYDFKEVQISEEKRLDVVITFYNKKYIVELKIWRGEKYHQKGLNQLCDYLERQDQNKGYLVIFDNKGKKEWKQENIKKSDREIFAVWV